MNFTDPVVVPVFLVSVQLLFFFFCGKYPDGAGIKDSIS